MVFTVTKRGPKVSPVMAAVLAGPAPGEPIATTIKLPEDTKARARAAAADAGLTLHAWLVEAVKKEADRAEKWRSFMAEADEAEEEFERTGEAIPLAEVDAHFKARAAGQNAPLPKAVKWPK